MFQLNSFSNIHYKGEEDQEVIILVCIEEKTSQLLKTKGRKY